MQATLCRLVDRMGCIWSCLLSVPQLVCVSLFAVHSCCLWVGAAQQHAVTRVVQQPKKTDERCGRGRSSVCYGSLVTRCPRNCHCSLVLPCALRCPGLAAAPAGGCLSARRNWVGTQSWQIAVVTGNAFSSHHVNLCDPAPRRESLSPWAPEQPCSIRFISAFLSKWLKFQFSLLLVWGRTCPDSAAGAPAIDVWYSYSVLFLSCRLQAWSFCCSFLSIPAYWKWSVCFLVTGQQWERSRWQKLTHT